tara:strand:+ start:246 stop:635 length:390 start_codon:yes stop_codon:yes gene_type:complete
LGVRSGVAAVLAHKRGNNMGSIYKGGQVQAPARPTGGGGLTSGQKGLFALAAVLVGPSLLKTLYEKPKEAVDLSSYNIVTRYDTPGAPLHSLSTAQPLVASLAIGLRAGPVVAAIERMDSTLRIEFCQS